MQSLNGRTLSHYRVAEEIGRGGMGVVYRAHDKRLDRDVAIKVLPEKLAADPERLRRFEREAKALAALNHPNIATVHGLEQSVISNEPVEPRDAHRSDESLVVGDPSTLAPEGLGRDGSLPVSFLVMELLEGESLRHRIQSTGLGRLKAAEVGAAVADGLAAAHRKGIIHRDLKPENIFITSDGRVKIVDFGLAQMREPVSDDAETATLAPALTEPGKTMGTVGYMSPEQLRGEPVDGRSDLFALGCVLYEMLAGRRAFACGSTAETAAAILSGEPEPLTGLGSELFADLHRVLDRCLEKQPAARFQSASDLAFALRQQTSAPPTNAVPDADDKPSIAVLPFGNLSGDAEQEYFCDGMAEEIINALVHVDGLRVVARTSSFAFKGRREDIRQIGESLAVGTILEGSVRKAGDRLRITAQLINVADGYHVWSERFDRTLEDVFAIQDEISLAIVDQLKVSLLGGERAGIVKRPTDNLDAYNAYLKGVYQWNRLTTDGYARSFECFQEAVELDDAYGPAYAYLAIWYLSQGFWGAVSPVELIPKAIEYAERALEIDESIPEAHSFRGVVLTFFQRDARNGARDLRRAVELGPNVAACHSNLAALLTGLRRQEEAIVAARDAQRLDPLSPTTNAWSCWWIGLNGRVEDGINDVEKVIAHQPDHWLPNHVLGDLLFRAERFDDAIVATERAVTLSDRTSISLTQLSYLKHLVGETDEADRLLDELELRWREAYVPPAFFSWIYRPRGDWEKTVEWLDRAAQVNDPWLPFHWLVGPMPAATPEIEAKLRKYDLTS